MISHEEHALWAALAAVPGIGRQTFRHLFDTLSKTEQKITQFWVSEGRKMSEVSLTEKQYISIKNFKKEHDIYEYENKLGKRGIRVALFCDLPTFPSPLTEIDDSPTALYIRCGSGADPWLSGNQNVAVIGSRDMTQYGKQATCRLVAELVELRCNIVSGCMYGVDATAHQSALDAGGSTIGVLGYGFDYCYPAHLESLQQRILASGGALITEYEPSVAPKKGQFAERNRLISGLSQAVVVVEAAQQSGTLITAQCALDQGKSVCAVPGPITSPYSEGTKWLLNQGATLVSSGADVLAELPGSPPTAMQLRILELLGRHPATSDELCASLCTSVSHEAQITTASLNQALTELEINGSIMRNVNRYELSHR